MIGLPVDALLDAAVAVDPTGPLQSEEGGDLKDWQAMGIASVMCLAVGAVVIKIGTDRYGRSRIVENTATERIRSMAMGRTELDGVARPYEETYPQPFQAGECVFGHFDVEELVSTEDDDGEETQEWQTIRSGTIGDRIVLEDDTGAVIVERPSMTYSDDLTTRRTQGRFANLFEDTFLTKWFDLRPNEPTVAFLEEQNLSVSSPRRRRYTQKVLPPGTSLYVLGQADRRDEDDPASQSLVERLADTYDGFKEDLVIERDEGSGEFIVSDKSEGELSRDNFRRAVGFVIGGIVLIAIGAGLFGLMLESLGHV